MDSVDRPAAGASLAGRSADVTYTLERFAEATVVPGGGATATAVVALAAALVAMTARRSRESWPEAGGAVGQAEALRDRAARLVQESAEAYEQAVERLRGTGVTDDAPEARDWELGVALERAAAAPLAVAEVAADVAELAGVVTEQCDPMVRGDAVAALLLAQASVRIGAHLVEINLATREDDERIERSRRLVARAERGGGGAFAAGA
jgi:methenyltetrahydrofolate cyclohydrolase